MKKRILNLTCFIFILCILCSCGGNGDNNGNDESYKTTVNAGSDQTVYEGSYVSLGAEASYYGETSFQWSQTSGVYVELDNYDTLFSGFTAPSVEEEEVLTFQLTLTDKDGSSVSDSINIYIKPSIKNEDSCKPTITNIPSQTVHENSYVILSTSVSYCNNSTFSWSQISGTPVELDNSDTLLSGFIAPTVEEEEILVFQFSIIDDKGNIAEKTVNITVIPDIISDIRNDHNFCKPSIEETLYKTVYEGQYISLFLPVSYCGSATFSWSQISGIDVELDNSETLSAGFTAPMVEKEETLIFKFTITDDKGNKAESFLNIYVIPDTRVDYCKPSINYIQNQTVYENEFVRLSAEISYCGDVTFLWIQTEGIPVEIINPNNSTSYFTAPEISQQEILTFEFIVTDSNNNTASSEITITVNPEPLSELCQILTSEESELTTNLDLSELYTKEIHNILLESDPDNAYQVFIRHPDVFMEWLDIGIALPGAVHETNHRIDGDLMACPPNGIEKYLFLGQIYVTELKGSDTKNYGIVEETINPYLKKAHRYDTYIERSKSVSGNRFDILLDEFTAYTGDSWFQLMFYQSGLPSESEYYRMSQFQIDGTVNFMVYLECYLKSSRLNYPETYSNIQSQEATIDYIQILWSKAEELLQKSYPVIISDTSSESIFFSREASGLDHLKEAYSDNLLMELDLLGITHLNYSEWQNSYFIHE